MVNRPSVPEVITVNSEELQTQIRDLLPSQNGFGSELQATNVIVPIIDLTAAAQGSGLETSLQQALNFGGSTAFSVTNTTTTLINSPGFYRVTGASNIAPSTTTAGACALNMTDGLSTKILYGITSGALAQQLLQCVNFDLIFWVAPGISLTASASTANSVIAGSYRQVADSEGNAVNPSGFPL